MRRLLTGTLTIVGLVLGAGRAKGADLKLGDAAPPFELPGSDGKVHSLAQLKGRTVVLAWFPKAFTGG